MSSTIIMATFRIKFRASSTESKEGTLLYQVIHNREVKHIHSGHKLYSREWKPESQEIIFPAGSEEERRTYLASLKATVKKDMKRLKCIILRLDRSESPYTAADVVSNYLSPSDIDCFISFARTLTDHLKEIGKQCTAETYTTVMNSFARFRKENDVFLEDMDSDLMTAYEAYLRSADICPNSISFYMRNLRAIYNRAVDKGLTVQRFPFRHVYTGIDKTVKRAVSLNVIRKIRELDLSLHPSMDYARDVFMFSFYTRGMSFVDIAFLKKKDLKNGILSYRRHKTDQQIFIKWEKPMQDLIDKYDTAGSPYMLPIIKNIGDDERRQYRTEAHRINRNLRKIGEQIGLVIPLTTYVARHGWASIAKSKNIPIATISEAMGHDSESTTRIYLASLDTASVDKANSLILKSL